MASLFMDNPMKLTQLKVGDVFAYRAHHEAYVTLTSTNSKWVKLQRLLFPGDVFTVISMTVKEIEGFTKQYRLMLLHSKGSVQEWNAHSDSSFSDNFNFLFKRLE
jgi:hypothetical protein